MIKIQIIKGKDLHPKTLKFIKKTWINAFGEYEDADDEYHLKELFFIVRNKWKKMLAVGTLQPIEIEFRSKTYKILGLGGAKSFPGNRRLITNDWCDYLCYRNEIRTLYPRRHHPGTRKQLRIRGA